MEDTYTVLAERSTGEYKEKGSKFIAFAFPVSDRHDVQESLEEVKGLHPKARHFCFAYRLGLGGEDYRANDDGEPSGTAGKPILGQLLSHELSDALIVVVRYFGGTKLGASGLIHAYKTASEDALNDALFKTKTLTDQFELQFEYGQMGRIMEALKNVDLEITSKDFGQQAKVTVEIPKAQTDDVITQLKAKILEVSTEQIDDKTTIEYCSIKSINHE